MVACDTALAIVCVCVCVARANGGDSSSLTNATPDAAAAAATTAAPLAADKCLATRNMLGNVKGVAVARDCFNVRRRTLVCTTVINRGNGERGTSLG